MPAEAAKPMSFPIFNEPLPSAVVFDLDGTLVDTAPDLCAATNYALASAGRGEVSADTVRGLIGGGLRRMIELGFETTGEALDDPELDRHWASALAYYSQNLSANSRMFEGVIQVLESLAMAKVPMAVCTNKPTLLAKRLLADLRIDYYFGAVLGGDALSVRKPDSAHLVSTIGALGVDPKRAVMVGDSEVDVNAARNSSVPVIVVSFGYTKIPAGELGADRVIDSYAELPDAIAAVM